MKDNSINDWNAICKYVKHDYQMSALKDFIVLRDDTSQYILTNEKEIPGLEHIKYYNIIPYYFFNDLRYKLENNYGFDKYPIYHFVYHLFKYKNDINTYLQIWFHAILTQIIENRNCLPFDREIIDYCYNIINSELLKKELTHGKLYGSNRTNFCPMTMFSYDYRDILRFEKTDDIVYLIEYISLIFENIKSSFRLTIIYG